MIERAGVGDRMSKIVKHNGVVYLAGQIGEGDTIAEQTRDCLSKIEVLLDEAGSSKEKILQAVIWLVDMSDLDEMNEIWDAWVPKGHAPARACGEVQLARKSAGIEITVIAAHD